MIKQLGEFLKDQQEPFALEVYLLERGYLSRSFNSEPNLLHPCFEASIQNKTLKKKRNSIPKCSKLVATFFSRLLPDKNECKIKNSVREMEKSREEAADDERFSSAEGQNHESIRGDIPSLDGSPLSIQEVTADGKFCSRGVEDSSQLSPVSVLEETEYDDGSQILKKEKHIKKKQEGSPLEKLIESSAMEMQEVLDSKFIAQYTKNKKAMLQTKQLLFDCIREIVEKQRVNNKKGQQFLKILGAEELWKLVYENIWLWSKEIIDERNIEYLVHFDLLALMGGCNNCEEQKIEIGIEIADAVLGDISNEIIADMVILFHEFYVG